MYIIKFQNVLLHAPKAARARKTSGEVKKSTFFADYCRSSLARLAPQTFLKRLPKRVFLAIVFININNRVRV